MAQPDKSARRRRRPFPWTALLVVGGLLLVLLLVVVGISKTDWVEESVRAFSERLVSDKLESRVTIGGVEVNVLSLEVVLLDVEVIPPSGGRLLRAERARVSLPLASFQVLGNVPDLDTVELMSLEISIEVEDGEIRNLPPPLARALKKPHSEEPEEPFQLPLAIKRLAVRDATVRINVVGSVFAEVTGMSIDATAADDFEGYDIELHADGGGIEMARLHESLRELSLKGSVNLDERTATLRLLSVVTPRVAAHLSGSVAFGGEKPVIEAEYSLATPLELISEALPPDLPALSGQVVIDGSASADLPELAASATVDLVDIHVAKFSLPHAHIRATLEDNGIFLEEVRVKVGSKGTGTITGFVGLEEGFPFTLDAEVEGFDLSFVGDALAVRYLPVHVIGRGKASVKGEFAGKDGFHMEGTGEGNASELWIALTPRATGPRILTLPNSWGKTKIKIFPDRLEFVGGRGGLASTSGTIDGSIYFAGPRLDFRTTATTADGTDLGRIAGVLFGGAGSAEATIRGDPSKDLEVVASGSFTGGTVNGRAVGDVTGNVRVAGDTVTVSDALLVRGTGRVEVTKLTLDLDAPGGKRIAADLAIRDARIEDLASLGAVADQAEAIGLSGQIGGWAHVEGPLKRPDVEAGLKATELHLLGEVFREVVVSGSYLDGVLTIDDGVIHKSSVGRVNATGTIGTEGELSLDVIATNLRIGDFSHPSVAAVGFDGKVNGNVHIGGVLAAPSFDGEVEFRPSRAASVVASGSLDLAGAGAIDLDVDARGIPAGSLLRAVLSRGDLGLAKTLDLPDLPGEAGAKFGVSGTLDAFAVKGRAGLTLPGGGGASAEGVLDAGGTVDLRVFGDAVPLLLALRTALGIADPVSGTWRSLPELEVALEVDGELEGPVTAPGFDGRVTLSFADGGKASLNGRIDLDGEMLAGISGTGLALRDVVPLVVALADPATATENLKALPAIGGDVTLAGTLSGVFSSPRLSGKITTTSLVLGEVVLGDLALDVSLGSVLEAKGTVLNGAHAEVTVELTEELPFTGKLSFSDIEPLAYVPGANELFPTTVARMDGHLSASGKLTNPDRITAVGTLTAFSLEQGDLVVVAVEPVKVALEKGTIWLRDWAHFESGGSTFAVAGGYTLGGTRDSLGLHALSLRSPVDGGYTLGGELDLTISGNVALSLLPMLVPGGVFAVADGVLVLDEANVTGRPESPYMVGRGRILGAELGFSFFPDRLRDFAGDVALSGNEILLSGVVGYLNGGQLEVNGTIDLSSIVEPQFDLVLDINEADIRFPDEWPAVLDGRVTIIGSPKEIYLKGDLDVLAVNYSTVVDWKPSVEDIVFSRRKHRVVELGTWGDETETDYLFFDIRLHAPDGGIFVKNNLAEIEAYMDTSVEPFRIHGTNRVVAIEGTGRARPGGIIYLFDKEFEVTRGEVAFDEAYVINPEFSVEAVTTIEASESEEYTVTVTARGPADKLLYELKSDPPLPPDDIVLLITLGATRRALESGTGIYGAVGASEIGGAILRKSGVGSKLPFDLTLGTRFSDKKGTFIPVLKASKRVTSSLRLSGSTSFVDPTGDFEAGGILKLKKGFSLHGTYEAADDEGIGGIGFDVRWKKKF